MATQRKSTPAGPATRGLKVVARSAIGFCRAGRQFGPEATIVPLSELTPDQVEAITNEPMLVAHEVDIEPST